MSMWSFLSFLESSEANRKLDDIQKENNQQIRTKNANINNSIIVELFQDLYNNVNNITSVNLSKVSQINNYVNSQFNQLKNKVGPSRNYFNYSVIIFLSFLIYSMYEQNGLNFNWIGYIILLADFIFLLFVISDERDIRSHKKYIKKLKSMLPFLKSNNMNLSAYGVFLKWYLKTAIKDIDRVLKSNGKDTLNTKKELYKIFDVETENISFVNIEKEMLLNFNKELIEEYDRLSNEEIEEFKLHGNIEHIKQKRKKHKSKFIAVFLNLLSIGAGHLYVGDIRKAIIFFPLFFVSTFVFYYLSTIYEIGNMLILLIVLLVTMYLYAFYDVINIIKKDKVIKTKYSNFLYIASFIILSIGFHYITKTGNYFPLALYKQTSSSMSDTILKNDNVVVQKNAKISRGDIVVFKYPKNLTVPYIKRCVAVSGDEILFQEKHLYISFHEGEEWMKKNYIKEKLHTIAGKTWVLNPYENKFSGIHYDKEVNLFQKMTMFLAANNFAMQPVIVNELPKNFNNKYNAFYKKVPQGEFYMIGDNRDHSNDSRFWGSVPKEYIIGKVKSIFINFQNLDRMGLLLDKKNIDKNTRR